QMTQQNIHIQEANVDLLKAKLKPSFNAGYALQKFYNAGWLNALQAGVKIPLFKKQAMQKIDAQQLQVQVAQATLQSERQKINQQLLALDNAIQVYKTGINFYKEQLEIINPEMERISKLNYQAGEISYLELLNTLNLLAKNNKAYWEQILGHNQAVILYNFLSGE
ncbi:MAG TPA: CusA/CzcA family heavy metal efflux RND transporter, partial [Saprospiraceae bacterium]|nr:CusA/CzcA family heavy metal efflux RND transporter [Saprospiraceae bacterium]